MIDLNEAEVQPIPARERLARAARRYAVELGLPIFPCRPREKTPLTTHGVHDASVDELQVVRWWKQWPDANIALATGGGLVVLDIDGPEGEQSLAALIAVHGPLPDTPEQLTGKGRHLLFSVDGETRNTSRKLGDGLDTRGDGGYIIVAPSIHPSGKRYAWVDGRKPSDLKIAPAPEWLLAGLAKRKTSQTASEGLQRPDPSTIPDAYVRRAVDGEYQKVAQAAPGSRNATINEASFALGQLVGAGVLDEATARRTLEAAADACGALNDEREKTLGTIARGIAAGIKQPRDLSDVGGARKTRQQSNGSDHTHSQRQPDDESEGAEARQEQEPDAPKEHDFHGEWLKDITYRAEPELVEGLLPATGLGFLYGPSSAGKSFIAIDWGLCLASGTQVLARPTLPSGVLYIAAEGQSGLRKRLVAARRQRDLDDVELPFNYLPAFIDLVKPERKEVQKVLAYAQECSTEMETLGAPLRLIIIDTMAAAAPGVDENTGKDMGPLIQGLQKLAADLNCLVLVVAHVGKDETRGLRGWSGSRAAADVAIECRIEREKSEDRESPVKRRYVWFEKAKDGPCGFTLADYYLRNVEIGKKPSGQPDTTCWVEYAEPPPPPTGASVADEIAAKARERQREKAFTERMLDAIVEHLSSNWISMTDTAKRLRIQGGITSPGQNKLIDLLRVMASDEHEGLVTIDRPSGRIQILTFVPSPRAHPNIKFRVLDKAGDGDADGDEDEGELSKAGGNNE